MTSFKVKTSELTEAHLAEIKQLTIKKNSQIYSRKKRKRQIV